ncbi:MAG: amidohydrolase family protein [Sphaerochaetaceae bacterium]
MATTFLFTNCTVIDGTGNSSFPGDVAIADGHILAIGNIGDTFRPDRVIDACSRILAPGFIDIHGHSELEILRNPGMFSKLSQGIVTEVTGNCGIGVFPNPGDPYARQFLQNLDRDVLGPYDGPWDWKGCGSFMDRVERKGTGTNLLFLQAHAPLRIAAMAGNPNRAASTREISVMVSLLEQAFDQGAVGFSSGLYYAPCMFATADELEALLRATARRDRLFAVHHRCEGNEVLESLEEVLDLALKTGVRLEISHLKAIGRKNQNKVPRMLDLIGQYHAKGVKVTFDQYPYEYGSTSLFSLLPPEYLRLDRAELAVRLASPTERRTIRSSMEHPHGWDSVYELCGWHDISVASLAGNPQYNGLSFEQIAKERGQDPFNSFFDVLAVEKGAAVMVDITQNQSSIRTIMAHPLGCFGTDALYSSELVHPRSWQAARHLLDIYQRQDAVLPIEKQIRRMTGEGAARLGLTDRGLIKPGFAADLVLLDIDHMHDCSTLDNPRQSGTGIDLVMVNGSIVYEQGGCTGSIAGRILRG